MQPILIGYVVMKGDKPVTTYNGWGGMQKVYPKRSLAQQIATKKGGEVREAFING